MNLIHRRVAGRGDDLGLGLTVSCELSLVSLLECFWPVYLLNSSYFSEVSHCWQSRITGAKMKAALAIGEFEHAKDSFGRKSSK